jgi:3-oxoacyl-[acyl-carrier-protein] synthase-1
MKRVVVTGLGIVSSIGDNAEEVRASLYDAKSGISFSPDFAEHGFRCQVWGAPKLDPTDRIDRRAMRFLSKGGAWNHIAMEQAIADAGLEEGDVTNERTGIIMGSGGASTRTIVEAADITRKNNSPKRIGPFAVPKAMSSTASATLATWFKIHGVNYSISSACSTSAHCIGNAYEIIQMGKQDIVFAGGHEDLDWTMSNLFDAMGAMSTRFNDRPSVASRAYDVDRDGFVIAGGAGVLVVEELEHAKARGARIHAEIIGYGATSDGFDMVAPSGEGAMRCMRLAMATVREPVDYINTHGTSTGIGDSKEIGAIRSVFGNDIPAITSTKSLTGHSLGAAGAQESIYSILMMRDRFIGESAHIETLDPEFDGMPIVRKRIDDARIDTVLSNSFGFGGTNATLVFQRYAA